MIQNNTNTHPTDTVKPKIIFFGNGLLADATLAVLQDNADIIFHAKRPEDLVKATELKQQYPEAFGVLASFGVMIRKPLLDAFEPEGILNLHPSKLPSYRGASPIETAILAGDNNFSYSIMKLAKKMDAGPLYHQETFSNLEINKDLIYQTLASAGAKWIVDNLAQIRQIQPTPQNDAQATFTQKLDKTMSTLHPEDHSAEEIFRQIVAYQNFPKPKYEFFGKTCIILKAHVVDTMMMVCDPSMIKDVSTPLMIKCNDRNFVAVDVLQPEGKKPMDARSFINGYGKSR